MKHRIYLMIIAFLLCAMVLCSCSVTTLPASDPSDSESNNTEQKETEPTTEPTTEPVTKPVEIKPVDLTNANYTISVEDDCIYYTPFSADEPYDDHCISLTEISKEAVRNALGSRETYSLICDNLTFSIAFDDSGSEDGAVYVTAIRSNISEQTAEILDYCFYEDASMATDHLHLFRTEEAVVVSSHYASAYFFTEDGIVTAPASLLSEDGTVRYLVRYFCDANGNLLYRIAAYEHFTSQPELFLTRYVTADDVYYGEEGTVTIQNGQVVRHTEHTYTVEDVLAANATDAHEWYEIAATAPYTTVKDWFAGAEAAEEYRSVYGCNTVAEAFTVNRKKIEIREKLICLMANLKVSYTWNYELKFNNEEAASAYAERISEAFQIDVTVGTPDTTLNDLAATVLRLSKNGTSLPSVYAAPQDFLNDEQCGIFSRADLLASLFYGYSHRIDDLGTDLRDFPSLTQTQRDAITALFNTDSLPELLPSKLSLSFYRADATGAYNSVSADYCAAASDEWNMYAFRALCLTTFTEAYYDELNCVRTTGDATFPVFLEIDRHLYYMPMMMGDIYGYDPEDLTDSYELVSATDDEVQFNRILHVKSDFHVSPYDMSILSCPVTLVRESDGWRVSLYQTNPTA